MIIGINNKHDVRLFERPGLRAETYIRNGKKVIDYDATILFFLEGNALALDAKHDIVVRLTEAAKKFWDYELDDYVVKIKIRHTSFSGTMIGKRTKITAINVWIKNCDGTGGVANAGKDGWDVKVYRNDSGWVFSHELGHNMGGVDADRYTSSGPNPGYENSMYGSVPETRANLRSLNYFWCMLRGGYPGMCRND